MKIKPEHLDVLKSAIAPLDTEQMREIYRRGDFPNADKVKDLAMRYRWDLFYLSKIKIGDGVGMSGLPLYGYMNDSHIDTALKSFIPDIQHPAPSHTPISAAPPAGKEPLRIDEWSTCSWAPTATPFELKRVAYVCRGMDSEDAAKKYAEEMSGKFTGLGVPSTIFVLKGPTSTTKKPYEVTTASAGYIILHKITPNINAIEAPAPTTDVPPKLNSPAP